MSICKKPNIRAKIEWAWGNTRKNEWTDKKRITAEGGKSLWLGSKAAKASASRLYGFTATVYSKMDGHQSDNNNAAKEATTFPRAESHVITFCFTNHFSERKRPEESRREQKRERGRRATSESRFFFAASQRKSERLLPSRHKSISYAIRAKPRDVRSGGTKRWHIYARIADTWHTTSCRRSYYSKTRLYGNRRLQYFELRFFYSRISNIFKHLRVNYHFEWVKGSVSIQNAIIAHPFPLFIVSYFWHFIV